MLQAMTIRINSIQIGSKIRLMRKRAGLTQEQLAELLDLTPQQIQKYEAGSNKINTDRLQEIAYLLKVPVQLFFLPDNVETAEKDEELMLLHAYRSIPNRQLQEALLHLALTAAELPASTPPRSFSPDVSNSVEKIST